MIATQKIVESLHFLTQIEYLTIWDPLRNKRPNFSTDIIN